MILQEFRRSKSTKNTCRRWERLDSSTDPILPHQTFSLFLSSHSLIESFLPKNKEVQQALKEIPSLARHLILPDWFLELVSRYVSNVSSDKNTWSKSFSFVLPPLWLFLIYMVSCENMAKLFLNVLNKRSQ
ncbi:hypothetical protein AVEN_107769-1 [Araneus ventricosus]|uniref:Uncharacterized protein n=1 Tax=Araneus ventricosus TaxID=182803 RepID=A0A4Y2K1Y9_ARAVE|nr:hypothetical protein AVEN_107769-1 [Araneus ventricosus]